MIEVYGAMARFSILQHVCRMYDVHYACIHTEHIVVQNVPRIRRVFHKVRNKARCIFCELC